MNPHESIPAILRRLEISSKPHQVLKNGTRDEIVEMLRRVTNLTQTYENGDTVYHVILMNERLTQDEIISISKIFRNRKMNPNTANRKGKTALHLAIEKRMKNVTHFFMKFREPDNPNNSNSALVKCFIDDEYTKFWYQARQYYETSMFWDSEKLESESAAFLQWLISNGIDFDHKSSKGRSPLDMALDCNLQHLLPILLENVNDKHFNSSILLDKFLRKNAFARRTYGTQPENHWYSIYSSRYAVEIVKILIDRAASKNDWGENVQLAIQQREDITIIKILLDSFLSEANESIVATSILNELMEYTCENFTHSKVDCYRQILYDLVAKGADVNQRYKLKLTAMQVAMKARNAQAVLWSNEVGTDFRVLTSKGESLLHLFLDGTPFEATQDVAIFDLLLSKGCQINAHDANGLTSQHVAAKNDNVALVKKLIENNAEIDCRDNNKRTPLHYAVMHVDSVNMVETLLEYGANVNARDIEGKDPLFNAVRAALRMCKMVQVLLGWRAQVNSLHSVEDELALKNMVRRVRGQLVAEFWKYGLEIKDSLFSRFVAVHRDDIRKLFELHKIKLKAVALPSPEFLLRGGKYRKLYEKCLKEIEVLKTTFIDTRTSLYRLLHLGLNERCIYINNEKLKTLVDSPVLEKQFPNYAILILANYREAVMRKSLLEPAKEAWVELTGIALPDICIECVFSYLSNMNLIDIIGV